MPTISELLTSRSDRVSPQTRLREVAAQMLASGLSSVIVVDGKVLRYRVQAPTDGFFADAAPLARLLANREFPSLDQARQALDQAILALDPCLPYTLELQDA